MVGRTILHYRIVGMLGSGGMGVVYEARDLQLDRPVALKFLPAELAADAASLERFQREARAASALNHPNICTIYAFEHAHTDDGPVDFLAMERLEGQSLDRLLGGRPLPVDVTLEIGIQVADALDAAHTRGIIHRDIKPANIFVQPRHRAKVLDFGLAKLGAARVGAGETRTVKPAEILTSPGSTLGTIAYMSPEQARGEELDARTDLFSFGAVLYEMCTGGAPFYGKTAAVIFQKILDQQAEPPRALNPEVPPKLEEIVLKALEKDRDLRCQTAAELRADLKRLQRDATASGRSVAASSPQSLNTAVVSAPPISSGSVLIAEARRHKLGLGVAAVAGLAMLGAAAFGIYHALTDQPSNSTSTAALKIVPLTTTGDITGCTSISPDGRSVVYCDRDSVTSTTGLRMRQVATGATAKLSDVVGNTTFSPDGNFVYVQRTDKEYPTGVLFVLPAIAGDELPQRVLTDINGPVALSYDGKQIAFVRSSFVEYSVVVAARDGSGQRPLHTRRRTQGTFGPGIAWSPDGKQIGTGYREGAGLGLMSVGVVDTATGAMRALTDALWSAVHRVVWLRDGSGMVFSADQPGETTTQLWLASYRSGQVKRITNDLHDYGSTSFAISDDDTIAAGQFMTAGDVWVSDADGSNPARVTGGNASHRVVGWAGEGRLVYSAEAPVRSLWTWSPAGGPPRRSPVDLTDIGGVFAAPGHDWIVFATAAGKPDIGRVNLDGSDRRMLTQNRRNVNPRVTADGAWVLYANWESESPKIWKVSAAGGTPILLSDRAGRALPGPDNQRFMAVTLADPREPGDPRRGIGIYRVSDGALERTVQPVGPLLQFLSGSQLQWGPDDQSLAFVQVKANVGNVWLLPLQGGEPHQLTKFESDRIFSYAFSPDGRKLAAVRGRTTGDVVLIRNFR